MVWMIRNNLWFRWFKKRFLIRFIWTNWPSIQRVSLPEILEWARVWQNRWMDISAIIPEVLQLDQLERLSSRRFPHNRPVENVTLGTDLGSPLPVEGRPPLLTRLCAGKSFIFIQSVPLPFLRKAGCECRPSAFYCVLILGSIICCNKCAVGRVTFTLILYAPKRSLPLAMDQRSRLL